MAGRFRYIVDDFYELVDEPIGWEDVETVLQRNEEDYGGIFLSYMTEFTFWGDGYNYINQQIINRGYCFSVSIKIFYKCSDNTGYETVFEGFVNIKTADVDHELCTVKANIEMDDIYTSFLDKSTTDINVGREFTYLPDGSLITLTPAMLNYHAVESGVDVFTGNNMRAYKVLDLFNYLSAVYTQKQLPVISDFFTKQVPLTEKWEIEFTGSSLKTGDTVNVTIKNYFGITFIKSQAFTSNEATTIAALSLKLINQVNVSPNIQRSQVQTYFDATSFANIAISGRKILLESWLPIEVLNVEVVGTPTVSVPTWTKTQSYDIGGKDLYVHPQFNETQYSNIWNGVADIDAPLSFKKLFLEIDKWCTLGMQLQGTKGNFSLRIEPLAYFFKPDPIMRIQGPINITKRFESDKNYNQVRLGSNMNAGSIKFGLANGPFAVTAGNTTLSGPTASLNEGQYILVANTSEVLKIDTIVNSLSLTVTQAPTISSASTLIYAGNYETVNNGPSVLNAANSGYVDATCLGDTLDLTNEFITDIEVHGDQTSARGNLYLRNLSASNKTDVFCFLQCKEDQVLTKQYKYMLNNAGEIYERWAFNGHMTNHHKIINNFLRLKNDFYVNASSNTEFAGKPLRFANDSIQRPAYVMEFEYFLSFTDMLTLIKNPQFSIEIETSPGIFESAWIYEVRMNINTKKTKFSVYTNLYDSK